MSHKGSILSYEVPNMAQVVPNLSHKVLNLSHPTEKEHHGSKYNKPKYKHIRRINKTQHNEYTSDDINTTPIDTTSIAMKVQQPCSNQQQSTKKVHEKIQTQQQLTPVTTRTQHYET